MAVMSDEKYAAHQSNPNVTVRIGGKLFRCGCGCNVFHHPDRDDSEYTCNSCGTNYTAE